MPLDLTNITAAQVAEIMATPAWWHISKAIKAEFGDDQSGLTSCDAADPGKLSRCGCTRPVGHTGAHIIHVWAYVYHAWDEQGSFDFPKGNGV